MKSIRIRDYSISSNGQVRSLPYFCWMLCNMCSHHFPSAYRLAVSRQYLGRQAVLIVMYLSWPAGSSASYSDATELPPASAGEVAAYLAREGSITVPYRSAVYGPYNRPDFVKIQEDPPYIKATGGELKDFQLTGLNWLAYLWSRGENGILADEVSRRWSSDIRDNR